MAEYGTTAMHAGGISDETIRRNAVPSAPDPEVQRVTQMLAERVEVAAKSFEQLAARIEPVLLPADFPVDPRAGNGFGAPLAQTLDAVLMRIVELTARIEGVTSLVQL